MRFYLDTAVVIYLVEQVQPYATSVRTRLSNVSPTLVTSELTRLECRVKTMRTSDQVLLQDFDAFFANSLAELQPLTRDVVERATELRARYNFKTPDALHLAAALVTRCDVFLTNDQRLHRCQEIVVELI